MRIGRDVDGWPIKSFRKNLPPAKNSAMLYHRKAEHLQTRPAFYGKMLQQAEMLLLLRFFKLETNFWMVAIFFCPPSQVGSKIFEVASVLSEIFHPLGIIDIVIIPATRKQDRIVRVIRSHLD